MFSQRRRGSGPWFGVGQLPANIDHEPSIASRRPQRAVCERTARFDSRGILIRRTGPTGHWHSRPDCSPPFCEDVPVPGARAALLLMRQRQKLETGEERSKAAEVAIV